MTHSNQVYYIKNNTSTPDYSLSLGIISRDLGCGKKIALIDTKSNHQKVFSFFENLSLTSEFKRIFKTFHLETFSWNLEKDIISRCVLPQVEYQTLPNKNYLLKVLREFDTIIFNDVTLACLDVDFLSIIAQTPKLPKIYIISSENITKELIKISNVYSLSQNKFRSLISQKIQIIKGSFLSELYAHGYLIEQFLNKCDVKFIAFNKGDQIYGEEVFFTALKRVQKNQRKGTFDFIFTGNPNNIKDHFTGLDFKEAQEGLELLKTSLKKQTPIVADNMIQTHIQGLIDKKEILQILSLAKQELLLPHIEKEIPKYIQDYACKEIIIQKE